MTDVEECVELYNTKVTNAIQWIQQQKETYLIKEEANNAVSCILVEAGKFYGMGLLEQEPMLSLDELKVRLTPYPENEVIRSMISTFVSKYPHKVLRIV